MYSETFRVKLEDWIKANGKKIPEWNAVGSRDSMSVHGKIVEYCDYKYEDWWDGDQRTTDGVLIKNNHMPFKCPIYDVELYLPLSFLYEKEKLRDIKIDNIIDDEI